MKKALVVLVILGLMLLAIRSVPELAVLAGLIKFCIIAVLFILAVILPFVLIWFLTSQVWPEDGPFSMFGAFITLSGYVAAFILVLNFWIPLFDKYIVPFLKVI